MDIEIRIGKFDKWKQNILIPLDVKWINKKYIYLKVVATLFSSLRLVQINDASLISLSSLTHRRENFISMWLILIFIQEIFETERNIICSYMELSRVNFLQHYFQFCGGRVWGVYVCVCVCVCFCLFFVFVFNVKVL